MVQIASDWSDPASFRHEKIVGIPANQNQIIIQLPNLGTVRSALRWSSNQRDFIVKYTILENSAVHYTRESLNTLFSQHQILIFSNIMNSTPVQGRNKVMPNQFWTPYIDDVNMGHYSVWNDSEDTAPYYGRVGVHQNIPDGAVISNLTGINLANTSCQSAEFSRQGKLLVYFRKFYGYYLIKRSSHNNTFNGNEKTITEYNVSIDNDLYNLAISESGNVFVSSSRIVYTEDDWETWNIVDIPQGPMSARAKLKVSPDETTFNYITVTGGQPVLMVCDIQTGNIIRSVAQDTLLGSITTNPHIKDCSADGSTFIFKNAQNKNEIHRWNGSAYEKVGEEDTAIPNIENNSDLCFMNSDGSEYIRSYSRNVSGKWDKYIVHYK